MRARTPKRRPAGSYGCRRDAWSTAWARIERPSQALQLKSEAEQREQRSEEQNAVADYQRDVDALVEFGKVSKEYRGEQRTSENEPQAPKEYKDVIENYVRTAHRNSDAYK